MHAVPSYDINVLQEMYSVILRIYKWGYLRGANKGSPKNGLFSGLAKRERGEGRVRFPEKVMSHYG